MTGMTNRRENIWRKKMLELEKKLLRYYAAYRTEQPDGSFCMGAFQDGYWIGRKAGKRK